MNILTNTLSTKVKFLVVAMALVITLCVSASITFASYNDVQCYNRGSTSTCYLYDRSGVPSSVTWAVGNSYQSGTNVASTVSMITVSCSGGSVTVSPVGYVKSATAC